ncbi:class A beta-lactamase-related serine hydrolase [Sphingomonas gei]|uniref:Class A beta-lactamase-related serine hydrolase n=1 Tax=Sphingomonas gei TaxID=1395960 RepID=A0A4S1XD90_9SPHN|nr:serine hydrolase domain-containing protein [Sphingomonas gei]TGX53643.1 class A beta-lactamase-related serine hydrolase [Sphingomonas gei]
MRSWRIFGSIAALALASPAWPQATVPLPSRAEQNQSATEAVAKRYVAEARVPGIVIVSGVGNAPPHVVAEGRIALEANAPAADADSLWRVYSMTKPITGIAAMILVEQGKLGLDQPISDFIPAFKDMKVLVDPTKDLTSRPATRAITVRNLLTHTAGLEYVLPGKSGPLIDEYTRLGINPAAINTLMEPNMRAARPKSLEEFADRLATLPLMAEPGSKWSYSIGLDLLGRVIEVAGGMPFDRFVQTRIFDPLKMRASYWTVPQDKARILATNYLTPKLAIDTGAASVWLQPPSFPYGGAGLVMSARDYDRFLHMLVNGGELEGVRILKPATVKLAMSDLLPASVDRSTLANMTADSGVPMGFGAGGSVYLADKPGGPGKGTYGWGGAAGTIGWADPVHKLRVTAMINSFSDKGLKREVGKAIYDDLAQ